MILGPSHGEDAAILSVGGKLIAVSCDPISGAVERIGWLAVNVSANDIATRGVRPRWFLSCIMLPKGSDHRVLKEICRQMDEAALKLGVSIVGGHSEVTPGLDHPLIIGFAVGAVERKRYVTCGGTRVGDKIILTKGAGIEGTAVLAADRSELLTKRFGEKLVNDAKGFFDKISVVDEALTAFEYGGVSAMHDPTEGGVAGGLHELADASKTGFRVYEEKVIIEPETLEICRFFGINPMQLISSGSLLIVVDTSKALGIVDKLATQGIRASVIGDMLDERRGRVIVGKNGLAKTLPRPLFDDLWVAMGKEA